MQDSQEAGSFIFITLFLIYMICRVSFTKRLIAKNNLDFTTLSQLIFFAIHFVAILILFSNTLSGILLEGEILDICFSNIAKANISTNVTI